MLAVGAETRPSALDMSEAPQGLHDWTDRRLMYWLSGLPESDCLRLHTLMTRLYPCICSLGINILGPGCNVGNMAGSVCMGTGGTGGMGGMAGMGGVPGGFQPENICPPPPPVIPHARGKGQDMWKVLSFLIRV